MPKFTFSVLSPFVVAGEKNPTNEIKVNRPARHKVRANLKPIQSGYFYSSPPHEGVCAKTRHHEKRWKVDLIIL
uniref:Uncharacterized protein n=1 Tax=Romanomermis culicivorax TaxID=13658 RepID=A0A915ITN4_ROMCU